jgi:hypothetical protein
MNSNLADSLLKEDNPNLRINQTARTTELSNRDSDLNNQKKENEKEKEIKLTPYRFVIVAVYFLLNFILINSVL